jgi:triosephosphate isomerase
MRKIIIAGNWKMNKTWAEALALFDLIHEGASNPEKLDRILLFPPYPYLLTLYEKLDQSHIFLGAQNISDKEQGAYTGEVSAAMIQSMGISYTLIGHSERRQYFGEDDAILKMKVDQAQKHNLLPVFCCGEQLEDRKKGNQNNIIESQISNALFHLDKNRMSEVIIAYEPVWAIGTGETASIDQAEDMHAFIRQLVASKFGDQLAQELRILYGGSCNSGNAKELFSCENVDGGLIGGASIVTEEFLKIISLLDD